MNVKERLFERWLAFGGTLTFDEWCTERRERAQQSRQQRAYAKRMAPILAGMQQASAAQMLAAQQGLQGMAQPYPQMYGPRSLGGLGGILGGGLFR